MSFVEQYLIEEMKRNKHKAKRLYGPVPEDYKYAACEYFIGYNRIYYIDKQGNWYFKVIDRDE